MIFHVAYAAAFFVWLIGKHVNKCPITAVPYERKMQKKELAVKRVLNDGAKAEILRLRDEGMEAAAIGKQLGLARTTV